MDRFPVFLRDFRRLMHGRLGWALTLLVSLLAGYSAPLDLRPPDIEFALYASLGVGGLLAVYWAGRTVRAEIEDETIEMLGTLPMTPISILLQIGSAAALASLVYSLCVFMIGSHLKGILHLAGFLQGGAVVVSLAWLGAMGSFHYQGSFVSEGMGMAVMGSLLGALLLGMIHCMSLPILVGVPAILLLGLAGALGAYALWVAAGGRWIESVVRPPGSRPLKRAKTIQAGPVRLWPVPHGVNPLIWHEVLHGRTEVFRSTVLLLAIALVTWVSGHRFGPEVLPSMLLIALYLGTPGLALTTASSTAERRKAGLWRELAVTPLDPGKIVQGHVLGNLGPSVGCVLLMAGALALLSSEWDSLKCLPLLRDIALYWTAASLIGCLAGSLTSSWKAGLLALILGYASDFVLDFGSYLADAGARWGQGHLSPFAASFVLLEIVMIYTTCRYLVEHAQE